MRSTCSLLATQELQALNTREAATHVFLNGEAGFTHYNVIAEIYKELTSQQVYEADLLACDSKSMRQTGWLVTASHRGRLAGL